MSSHQDIIDNLKIVCQCKGIKKGAFKKVLANNLDSTITDLQKETGAGGGDCQGRRCTPRIQDLLAT